MKSKFKTLLLFLLCVLMVPAVNSPVHAEEKTGSITIQFPDADDLRGSSYGLWQVALTEGDENGEYYQLTNAFSRLSVNWNDMADQNKVQTLTRRVGAYVSQNKTDPNWTLTIDQSNVGKFENLAPGVYYGKQTKVSENKTVVTDFLMTIPYDGKYDLTTFGKHVDPYKETTQTTPPANKEIPKTGMEGWKVPFFAFGGLVLIAAGVVVLRKKPE